MKSYPLIFAIAALVITALACSFNLAERAEQIAGTALATAGVDLDEAQEMFGTAMSTEFTGTLEALEDLGGALGITGSVILEDDFSDSGSGWDRTASDQGSTDYENGGYRIFVNTDDHAVWANPNRNSYTDVQVEVDAVMTAGPTSGEFGIICRHADPSNFYVGSITSDGFYGFWRVTGGNFEILGTGDFEFGDAILQGNATNHIRLDCIGSTLTLYANGVLLGSVTDSTHANGDVGLYAGTFDTPGTEVLFDNFVVYQP